MISCVIIAVVLFGCALLLALSPQLKTFALLFLLLWFAFSMILCGAATASSRPLSSAVIAVVSCLVAIAFTAAVIWT